MSWIEGTLGAEQPVEMWRQGEWQRGQVQFREHHRYCWTDGRAVQRLEDGARARVWAGREMPPPRAVDLQYPNHLRPYDLSR